MSAADRFGNPVDPTVGYARGALLGPSADEVRRLRHAQRVTAEFAALRGAGAVGIFTGNARRFPLQPDDLERWCEEWTGPGRFADRLREVAVAHLGGRADDHAAVVNRTSGGIVAAVLALAEGRPVVSVVPGGDRSHASLRRGCRLARVELVEIDDAGRVPAALSEHAAALVVVTTVTSTLARLDDADTAAAIDAARSAGAAVLMDEAYGARLRPVLHGGAKSLEFGADAAITNTDKAGLCGPRAGVVVGCEESVVAVMAAASELGIEARAPIAAGALRSLEAFDPSVLRQEAIDGNAVADALETCLGTAAVARTDLGPSLSEDTVLGLIRARAGAMSGSLVPCEATAAVAMVMLRDQGVLTVSTHGQPGGRVSLRLKPTPGALEAVGGAERLAEAVNTAISTVARRADDRAWVAALLFGADGERHEPEAAVAAAPEFASGDQR